MTNVRAKPLLNGYLESRTSGYSQRETRQRLPFLHAYIRLYACKSLVVFFLFAFLMF